MSRTPDVHALFDRLRRDAEDIANAVDAGLADASNAALARLPARLDETEEAVARLSGRPAPALVGRVEALAGEVGRLRRRLANGPEHDSRVAGRIAAHVEAIDGMLAPTAAARFRANIAFGADEAEAVAAALEDVDERARQFRQLLGEEVAA